jgi:hypothetical protein
LQSSNGVRIETSCGNSGTKVLRLTGDHLVYTSAGLRSASNIAIGDTVFGDLTEIEMCHVFHVTKEDNSLQYQTYFGLNCVDSVVLADGIKTSTFGLYNFIPAAWMKYASRLLGVKRASSLGDSIVQWLNKMKLL